jgi:hypothetical protein
MLTWGCLGALVVFATSHVGAVVLGIEGATVSAYFYLVHSSFYSQADASNAKGWWGEMWYAFISSILVQYLRWPSMFLYIMFRYVFPSSNKSDDLAGVDFAALDASVSHTQAPEVSSLFFLSLDYLIE